MGITSGVIPYTYEEPYPLIYGPGEKIGYSGLRFEEPMAVVGAENLRVNGFPGESNQFDKYVNRDDSDGFTFVAHPDGRNLDGRLGVLPAKGYTDYITFMRTRWILSWLFMQFDFGDPRRDWLTAVMALYPGAASGQNNNFEHREASSEGEILNNAPDVLGASGIIYDIDLMEMMYTPFCALGGGSSTNYGFNGTAITVGPIWPNFQTTGGSLVRVGSRESGFEINGHPFSVVAAGLVEMYGDQLFPATQYLTVPADTVRADLDATVSVSFTYSSSPGREYDNGGAFAAEAAVRVTPGSLALNTEGYAVGVRNLNSLFPGNVCESGSISFRPRPSRDTNDEIGVAYSAFNSSFWLTDETSAGSSSGMVLIDPIQEQAAWFRMADATTAFDDGSTTYAWKDMIGMALDGNDLVRMIQTNDSDGSGTDGYVFVKYDRQTLDISSTTVLTDGTLSETPIDFCYDGSSEYIAVNTGLSGDEWIFIDSSLSSVTKALDNPPGTSVDKIQNGFLGKTYALVGGPGSTVDGLLDVDTSMSTGSVVFGTNKIVDTTGSPSGFGSIAQIIDGDTLPAGSNITAGAWLLVRTTTNRMYMIRITDGGSTFTTHEYILCAGYPTSHVTGGQSRSGSICGVFTIT